MPGVPVPFRQGSQGWLSVRGCSEIFQEFALLGLILVLKRKLLCPQVGYTPHRDYRSARTCLGSCRKQNLGLGPLWGGTGCRTLSWKKSYSL